VKHEHLLTDLPAAPLPKPAERLETAQGVSDTVVVAVALQ